MGLKLIKEWLGFLKPKPLPKWRLVKTVSVDCITVDKTKGVVWVHFFESENGKRRFEFTTTLVLNRQSGIERLAIYSQTIYPWLNGAYVPDIPLYSDMDVLDVQSRLEK